MEENGHEYELVVSQGKRPIWCTLIAAVSFTIMLWAVIQMTHVLFTNEITENLIRSCGSFMQTIGFSFAIGLRFSIVKTVLIDLDKDKLISRYNIGFFTFDYNSAIPELSYVAVFKNAKAVHEVNLWYKGNRHYNMYCFEDETPAFEFAEMVRTKLNLDLLDATERGDFKWVERIKN